jgi:hypothetical protein
MGKEWCRFEFVFPGGKKEEVVLNFGEVKLLGLGENEKAEMTARPSRSGDVGSGAGKEHRATVTGGVVGLILDGRGRLKDDRGRARLAALPTGESERRAKLGEWVGALKMYPRAV